MASKKAKNKRDSKSCGFFILVKVGLKGLTPPPGAQIFESVIWNIGWDASSAAAPAGKSTPGVIDVSISTSLGLRGAMEKLVEYDIQRLPADFTLADAKAKLDSAGMAAWRKNAIAISIHRVEVGLTKKPAGKVACVVVPS